MSKIVHVTGWHAENIAREFTDVKLYSTESSEQIDVEKARELMHWKRCHHREDADKYVHADVPIEYSFELKLKYHDWTYEYSDDHRYWTAGVAATRVLQAMAKEVIEECGVVKTAELVDKYAPEFLKKNGLPFVPRKVVSSK